MKILVDIRPLMDEQYSGIAEYTKRLLTALFAIDDKNEYVLFYNSWKNIDLETRLPEFNKPNIRFVRKKIPNKIFNYGFLWFLGRPFFDRWLGGKFDIFFMPHIQFMAISAKTKSILTVHDLSFLVNPEFFSWRKNVWHWFINVRRLAKKFDRIVAVSEHTRRDLIDICGVAPERVTTIYSAVDSSFCRIDKNDPQLLKIQKKYNLDKPFILFLATIEPRKNIESLCAAFALLKKQERYKDLQLVLAGGRGWKSGPIFKTISAAKISSDIKLLDYVDETDRPYLYNLATVFAFPSLYEGFGFPPLEAMACGTPVVAAATSSLPEIIGQAGILIDPYNPSAIALGLETVLSNNELAQELSSKGQERAKKFSWSKAAAQYLKLFEELKNNG